MNMSRIKLEPLPRVDAQQWLTENRLCIRIREVKVGRYKAHFVKEQGQVVCPNEFECIPSHDSPAEAVEWLVKYVADNSSLPFLTGDYEKLIGDALKQ